MATTRTPGITVLADGCFKRRLRGDLVRLMLLWAA
jgi:hypothetical protein